MGEINNKQNGNSLIKYFYFMEVLYGKGQMLFTNFLSVKYEYYKELLYLFKTILNSYNYIDIAYKFVYTP